MGGVEPPIHLFPPLCLLPERFHLLQAGIACFNAPGGQHLFDVVKAAGELGIGGAQGCFGVDLEVTRQVGDHEQQVADFLFPGGLVRRVQDLARFLGQLVQHQVRVVPVEAYGRSAALQFLGAGKRGQGAGNIIQQALLAGGGAFALLQLFPEILLSRRCGLGIVIAEDMGMTPDHLGGDGFHHIAKIEQARLLGHAGVKHHLKKKIAQFTGQGAHILVGDGRRHLIGFLDGIGRDGVEGLDLVPGTGFAQAFHHLQQHGHVAGGFKIRHGPIGGADVLSGKRPLRGFARRD